MQWINYFTIKKYFSGITKKNKNFQKYGKINVVLVNKIEDKTFIINYRPISLLLIFEKISERLKYSPLLNYLLRNKDFTSSQTGFLPGDSFIAQLLSRLPEIQIAFGENPTRDLRHVSLDISKAFDKIWHGNLIFKLKA